MPFWDWHEPTRLRRESQRLRQELLLAVGELTLFTAGLKAEMDHADDGGTRDDQHRPGEHPSAQRDT